MFFPETHVKIWLYAKPTDMRRSFNGLAAMAKNLMGEDPLLCSGLQYVAGAAQT